MNRRRITEIGCIPLFLFAFASAAQTNSPVVQFGEKNSLHSKILNEDRPYLVYLPPSYKANRDHAPQKYPVIYLLDGEWNFEWVCEVAQFMGDTQKIPELIVVGILNTDRERDLTPTHATNNVSSGGGPLLKSFWTKNSRRR